MERIIRSNSLRQLILPLLQLGAFILSSGVVLSLFVILLAWILQPFRTETDLLGQTLSILPSVLIDAVTLGFVYASIALGYTMVYGVLEFINFAHSEIFMVGAFMGTELVILVVGRFSAGINSVLGSYALLFVAIIFGSLIAGLLAMGIERVAYRPLRGAPRLVPLISAIGVSFLLQDVVRLLESFYSGQFFRIWPTFGDFDRILVLGNLTTTGGDLIEFGISIKSLIVIIVAVFMLVGLNYLVNVTKLGTAIRATAQDRNTASLMGINVNYVIGMTFLIGGALGGAAGVLFAFKFLRLDPFVGFLPGLKAFTAAVLGGIGNLTGALLGGIILGMLESFAASYLSFFTQGAFGAEYKDILAFAILIIILIFRPSGLLGQTVGQKA
ncbi:MAG: branched-chain amino acid ABC transporter permease [Anaerolineales bacterium]|nr:branched-chain amino acid ABC transporter permease [Anaerolineales bacterium]